MPIFLTIDWTAGPEILRIGSFALRWYSLMFVIGFFVGLQIMTWVYNREGKNTKELDMLLFVMLFGAIFGARMGEYIFYNPSYIFTNPIEVFLPISIEPSEVFGVKLPFKFIGFQGLASHGAVFSILALLYWYSRKYKHNYMWLVDRIAITVAFAAIFIRIGNFFNHEIVGVAAKNIPWAVKFKLHENDWAENIYRHPAQLYESFCYLITFVVLYTMYKKGGARIPYGKLFGLFMMMIFGARFLVEFLKTTQSSTDLSVFQDLHLKTGQLLSIPMVLVGAYFFFVYSKGKGKRDMEKALA